ncbi:MAG: hypothetical protein IJP02_04565 [Oscillospiraceae bacterium]|nr:hypothetical protein [Oscillospiraceae bacterium]
MRITDGAHPSFPSSLLCREHLSIIKDAQILYPYAGNIATFSRSFSGNFFTTFFACIEQFDQMYPFSSETEQKTAFPKGNAVFQTEI